MKSRNAILVSELLIAGLAALIALLTAPEARMETAVFWIAFSFAIPVNFLAAASFTVWGFGKAGNKFMRLPTALYSVGIFGFALLLAGFLYMYLDVVDVTWPIIVFAAITVFYVILAIYSVLGTSYMSSVEAHDKEKRLFIKMLEADVTDCVPKASAPASQAALRELADKVRFSDPMSHASLSGIEAEISSLVLEISADLTTDPAADVTAKVTRARVMLDSRNNRCLMLK